ncbi:MAG: flagellar hook-basal body complex protein [Tatlockia sp.]|nr:flagellar hook-basal body complex protein [Tatlockia sp.]
MSNCYYSSLTGMLAASFGLQNTSHNIANMQSPGFKRSDVFYSCLGNGQSHDGLGSGVRVAGTSTNFNPGTNVGTGNPSDLAIGGQGFFIVRQKNGELVYTRDGEFGFNKEGQLVDKHSGGLVMGYNEKGDLIPIQQFGPKTKIGKATTLIDLAGEFILIKSEEKNPFPTPDKPPSIYKNIKFSLADIFDAKGKEHSLELEFKPIGVRPDDKTTKDGLQFDLEKVLYDGNEIDFDSQSLQFMQDDNGAPQEGDNLITLKLPNYQTINLNFGTYNSEQDKSVRLNKTDLDPSKITKIKIHKQDGYTEGKQTSFSFDENGQISYSYDNNQSVEGVYVALAKFDDLEHTLIQTNNNLFRSKNDSGRQIGRANKGGFGNIQASSLESSNVNSTTEFANIVVLQRMFQACSQIMDIDKQLLEELFKK